MRDPRRRTIAVDFDGVLNPLSDDGPDALRRLRAYGKLVVFTARRGHDDVVAHLVRVGVWDYFDDITSEKGRFDLIVDDMPLVQFTGDWDVVLDAATQLAR